MLITACRVKISTAKKELCITAIFGAIFLVVVGGFTPYSVVRSIDRQYQLNADIYVAVSVCYGVATCSSPLIYGALSTQIRQACGDALNDLLSIMGRSPRPPTSSRSHAVTATGAGQHVSDTVRMRMLADVEVSRGRACSRVVALTQPSNCDSP